MSLVDRAKNILMRPKEEWPVIETEPQNTAGLLTGYVLPLAAIPAIASLIGWTMFGVGGLFRVSIGTALGWAITQFVLAVLSLFVLAFIANALAPRFGGQENMGQALKLCAYASTAAWVAGIFNIIPALSLLAIIGAIYSLYLLYLGVPVMMKVPAERAAAYIGVIILAAIVLAFVISAINRAFM